MYSNWKEIPIPDKMKSLEIDPRGYPVPYVILKDDNGEYHFKINSQERVNKCVDNRLCSICGTFLGSDSWLIGGPKSAYHPNGAFIDTPMHHDCGEYALKVCPYLAYKGYRSTDYSKDKSLIRAANNSNITVFVNPTQDMTRPPYMCFVKISGMTYHINGDSRFLVPYKPYLEEEWWKDGKRISKIQAEIYERGAAGILF